MPIDFHCAQCGRVGQAADSMAGKKAKCSCGAILDFTAPAPAPVPVAEVAGESIEARAAARNLRAATAGAADPDHAVFRIGPVALVGYVAIMIFLPLCRMECMGQKFEWTGIQLLKGDPPSLPPELQKMADSSGGRATPSSDDMPADPLVIAYPILALIAGGLFLAGQRKPALIVLSALTAVFLFNIAFGFTVERKAEADLAKGTRNQSPPQGVEAPPAEMAEAMSAMAESFKPTFSFTTWYWVGLVATLVALALAVLPVLMGLVLSRAGRG